MLACTTGRHRPLSQEDMWYAAYRGSDPRNRLSTHSLDSAPIGPYGSNTQGGSRYATLPARTNKGWHAVILLTLPLATIDFLLTDVQK